MENINKSEVIRRRLLNQISRMTKDQYEWEIGIKTEDEIAKMIQIVNSKKAKISFDNRSTNYQRYESFGLVDADLVDIATIKSFELACIFRSSEDFAEANIYALDSENPDVQIARDFNTDEEHVKCYRLYDELEKKYKKDLTIKK